MKESLEYQENLEEIFRDFSNITIIIKDNYNFSYLNRLTTNLLGFKESEILEMSFIELLTPDSLENCIDNIRLLRETGFCQPFIVNLLKKNGEIVSLELSGIKLDDGRFFFMGRNLSLERLRKEKLEYLEEFNKNILNSIGEGIVVLNPQGNIIKYNDFMEKNFQWKKAEIIGKNAFELFPDLKEQGLLEAFVNIVDKGRYEKRTNIVSLRPDGKKFMLNLRGYPLKIGSGGTGVVIVVEDITKSEEISRQIKRTVVMREKIHKIIESIIPLNTIPKILDRLSLGLREELGYERGGVFLIDKEKKRLALVKLFSSINTESEINTAKEKISIRIAKKEGGITSKVFRTGKSRNIMDIRKEKNALRIFPDTKSELVVPIKMKDEPIGVITIDSCKKGEFDETDLKFVEMLANNVAITIKKIRFYEDLLKKLQYLSILYETSQILQGTQQRKANYVKVLKHLALSLTDYTTLILRFNNKKEFEIIASFNATEKLKNIFSRMSRQSKQKIINNIRKGNPFIADNIKQKKATLFRELYKKDIRTLHIFPFFSEDEVIGCLVLLYRVPSTLRKDQISLLIAIANQLSSTISQLNPSLI